MSWMNKYGQKRAKNKRLIQQHLDDAELNGPKIAEKAGVTRQAVSATINGHLHSERVLDELRKAGVPERLLCDPRKHPEQATA